MTGYVHNMIEREQTFQEFALSCARAFGALVEMRDSDMNANIPAKLEPSTYHVEAQEKAVKEYKRLLRLDNTAKIAFGEKKSRKILTSLEDGLAKQNAETAKLKAMLADVKAWEPPTKDHAGLKSFMSEQLTTSMSDGSFYDREIQNAKARSPKDYYTDALASAQSSIEYHAEHYAKEVERTNERNEWLRQLRDSLTAVNA